jgi:hypothetical protein
MHIAAEITRKAAQRAVARRKLALLLDAARERPAPTPVRAYGKAYGMDRNGLPSPVAPTSLYNVKIAH